MKQAVLTVSRYIISTTFDYRSHPLEPRTSIVTPNTIITFRFCCNWVLGVPQKILEYLIEGHINTSCFISVQAYYFNHI